jgi:rhodanese-related sulfurtransferase
MNSRPFTRRRLLQATGASLLFGSAGCLGTADDSKTPDGYPPKFEEVPPKPSVDVSSFEPFSIRGIAVPLAPLDVVYDWYRRREARFADARGEVAYNKAHILGAVLSPAAKGQPQNDPIKEWPKSDRIITYCSCPHHLSSLRAANLIKQGYKNVYALESGFIPWIKRNYPVKGTEVKQPPKIRTIVGATDPRYAGKTAWAYHRASGQREVTKIEQDGHYRLDLPFYEVTGQSLIEVVTPAYTIEKPLSKLIRGKIMPGGTFSLKQPSSQ